MYLSLLFWFGLILPGYVVIRHIVPGQLRCGLPGAIALSWLAMMAILSPVSILCYVFGAPLWIFSGACLLAVIASVVVMFRRRWWGQLGGLLAAAACIELVIVLADLFLGAWIGAFFGGDALVHLARIRYLLDHCVLSNVDPFIAQPHFFPIYHTNLLHALYAAASQLTGIDPYSVWFVSLAWGKLLIVCGAYYLAWRIFDHPWAGWIAAIFVVAARGTVTFTIYPNQLAPFWLLPVMFGVAIGAVREGFDRWTVVLLAAGSLVLGQLHGLYVIFAIMLLGPVLLVVAMLRFSRSRPDRVHALLAVLVLATGLPFVVITQWKTVSPPLPEKVDGSLVRVTANDPASGFIPAGDRWLLRDPKVVAESIGGLPGVMILCAAVLLGITGPRRLEVLLMLGIVAPGAAVMFIPPVCAFLLERAGEGWILQRLDVVFQIGLCVIAGPAVGLSLHTRMPHRAIRVGFVALVLLLAGCLSGGADAWTWREVYTVAKSPYAARTSAPRAVIMIREFLAEHMPPGSVVLTSPVMGMQLVQAYDCHIVASISASNGVPDMQERLRDLMRMLAGDTPWEERRRLLHKHEARHFFPHETPIEWTVGHVEAHWLMRPFILARLKLD